MNLFAGKEQRHRYKGLGSEERKEWDEQKK